MRHAIDKINAYLVVLFYTLIMVFGILIKHPLHLTVILISGIIMALIVAGGSATLKSLSYCLIFSVLIIIINPLVSKEGMTKIVEIGDFYITLESLAYGGTSALMLSSVFMWFVSFNVVMTGDKYIYVLGRFLPSFSLLISLVLRLIPQLNRDFETQKLSLKSMGMYKENCLNSKLKLSIHALQGVIRRSIENSSIRADSMEARGYGIAHRNSYLKYGFKIADLIFLILTIILGVLVIVGHVMHHSFASYYPIINIKISDTYTIVSLFILTLFVLIPIVFEAKEGIVWKQYLSKISQ